MTDPDAHEGTPKTEETDAPTPSGAARWTELEGALRRDSTSPLPPGEPTVATGRGAKRWVKRAVFRTTRPVSRRYDRLVADAAALGSETAQEVERTNHDVAGLRETIASLDEELANLKREMSKLRAEARQNDRRLGTTATELEVLSRRLAGAQPPAVAPAARPPVATGPTEMPADFYERFENELRGSPEAVEAKLRQYEDFAVALRDELGGSPLWLDLGCGEGGFALLLQSWGWRVLGMDISPEAVQRCQARGIDAVEGALPDFLLAYPGERPAAISAMQVIEHLPTDTWLPTIRYALDALAPDGALLIETINPLNAFALGSAFFTDVTHTWPANPRTLEVMASYAGFDDIETRFLNPDDDGEPQDFALIARKRV